MENTPYASIVGSLMYAQTCTRPDISFAVSMLGAKKVLRYLLGTKNHMFTYKRFDHLKVIDTKIQILLVVWILESLHLVIC